MITATRARQLAESKSPLALAKEEAEFICEQIEREPQARSMLFGARYVSDVARILAEQGFKVVLREGYYEDSIEVRW